MASSTGKKDKIKVVHSFSPRSTESSRFCSFTCTQGTRYASYKDSLPWVQWLRAIHHKVTIIKVPGPNLDLEEATQKNARRPITPKAQIRCACRRTEWQTLNFNFCYFWWLRLSYLWTKIQCNWKMQTKKLNTKKSLFDSCNYWLTAYENSQFKIAKRVNILDSKMSHCNQQLNC